ncbi:hypothetical protein D3C83_15160 [compost metagenome]
MQKHERDAALAAEFDEMCALERGLREQYAVVGDNSDRKTVDVRKAAHQCCAIARLEFIELARIDEPRNDLADIERSTRIFWNDAVEFALIVSRRARVKALNRDPRHAIEVRHRPPRELQRMAVVIGEVVCHA